MSPQTQNQKLALIGLASLVFWAVATFPVMILYHFKGGLANPGAQTVPIYVYRSAVEFSEGLFYRVIPSLTFGYLLFGLLVLRLVARAKKDDAHNS
jgi:hypothetical protein